MNYNAIKNFVKKIFVAMLLVALGKFFLAAHCAVLGLPLVFIGDYRMAAAVLSLLGENFFGSLRLDNISSRIRRFVEGVKEKAEKLEH